MYFIWFSSVWFAVVSLDGLRKEIFAARQVVGLLWIWAEKG